MRIKVWDPSEGPSLFHFLFLFYEPRKSFTFTYTVVLVPDINIT